MFDVTCAVPRTGRTLINFLSKLKSLVDEQKEIDQILHVLKISKQQSSPDIHQALEALSHATQQAPSCFSIFVDRKREQRPYRIGFLSYEWTVGEVHLRVEGEEPHNGSSLIKLDEVDFALVGLDELLSMTQHYLRNPETVTKWGMYNYHLEKPTGIRVAGSANLTFYNHALQSEVQDIVGFFLISKSQSRRANAKEPSKYKYDLDHLSKTGQRVFVKGRYTGIVNAAYPGLKIISVEDVEDAILLAEKGSIGIEIVQSGNTVKEKELFIHGAPLFLSESLYVVDYDRYSKNEKLRQLIKTLCPVGYFEEQRIQQFAQWYHALENNLGDHWIDKPSIETLFCEPKDVENGLRPYRLKTRYWKPDDQYRQDVALELVRDAKQRVKQYYNALK
ncbi:hypothetical protein WDW89_06750 [Deltaproteobacteria bacterium TL4]